MHSLAKHARLSVPGRRTLGANRALCSRRVCVCLLPAPQSGHTHTNASHTYTVRLTEGQDRSTHSAKFDDQQDVDHHDVRRSSRKRPSSAFSLCVLQCAFSLVCSPRVVRRRLFANQKEKDPRKQGQRSAIVAPARSMSVR